MKRLLASLGLLAAASLPLPLAAAPPGGISVSPVRVDLEPRQHAAAITVINTSGEPRLIQVEPSQWTQPAGTDEYAPTRELVVNPPLFRLAPGASQVVRIGLARQVRADRVQEKAFRVFFQELPDATGPTGTQLQILLRIGVPVFVRPQEAASARLDWTLERAGDDQLLLKVRNLGELHERVSALSLQDDDAATPFARVDGFAYVLPGQMRQWEIKSEGALPQRLRLTASGEGGPIHAELPLPAR